MRQLETMRILTKEELYQAHASRLRGAGAYEVRQNGCLIGGRTIHWTWAINLAATMEMCDWPFSKAVAFLQATDAELEREHIIPALNAHGGAYRDRCVENNMRREWLRFWREETRR